MLLHLQSCYVEYYQEMFVGLCLLLFCLDSYCLTIQFY